MTTSDKQNPTPLATKDAVIITPSGVPAKKTSTKKAPANKPKAAAKSGENTANTPTKTPKTAKPATAKPPTEKPKAPAKAAVGKKAPAVKKVSAPVSAAPSGAVTAMPANLEPTPIEIKPTPTKIKPTLTAPTPVNTVAPVSDDSPLNNSPSNATTVAKKSKAAQLLGKHAAKSHKKADFLALSLQRLKVYSQLMRLDRPIGILLLLWPTFWSLWLAAKGMPSLKNLLIFSLGVVIMRSAGCVINDFADRKIDSKVKRTQDRPLATGAASNREAITLFVVLCLLAFGLVLLTNPLTIKLSVGGLLLAFCYPFMKRHTHLPQIVLGAAFAWSIPMAFAAEAGELPQNLWLIYLAVVLWTVVYDTFYAMVDRDDDIKIGVKSTAILFGEQDRFITGLLQAMTLYTLFIIGDRFELSGYYYTSIAVAAGLFAYQQWLIRFRARAACFSAFLNNNWVGLAIFVGIAADFALR